MVRKFRRWLFLFFFLVFLVGVVHFWVSDRLGVLRVIYPAEAALAWPSLDCTEGAPRWLGEALSFSLWEGKSLSDQIAYVSPAGEFHECHHGWKSTPILSSLVTEQSRFRYASMTKLLTADMVLREVRRGNLSLEDALADILSVGLPLVDERVRDIKIEHLLRHSAGFDRLRSIDPMVERDKKPWCPSELEMLSKVRLDFEPGERYAYSNLNYCLLAVVLERVTGQSFRELMEKEYRLAGRGIRFLDGDYLADEVEYDFRNSDFYTESYWKYFDFKALSSSAGLSGSAGAFARLLKELRDARGYLPVTQAKLQTICDETILRGCYGYAAFSYQPAPRLLRVHVQPGFLYASPSVAMLDEKGGITVWVGSGMRLTGDPTDPMVEFLYQALDEYYAQ